MRVKKYFSMIAALAAVLLAAAAQAQFAPPVINYQGHLLGQNGFPFSGTVSMDFSIFDAATGDSALYTETQTVTVVNGLFSAAIGSVTLIPQTLFDRVPPAGFLEIAVDGNRVGPRKRLGAVAYAFNSGNANIDSVIVGAGLEASAGTGAVTLSLADDGVTSRKILDGTITADDLAANSVDSDEIAANAVSSSLKISAGAVGSSEIAAGAVGTNELADNLLIGADFADGAVGSAALANLIDVGEGGAASGNVQMFSSEMSQAAVEIVTFVTGGGLIRTFNDNGDQATEINRITEGGAGRLTTRGPNGNYNVKLWDMSESSNPVYDFGAIDVYDADGVSRAGIYIPTIDIIGGGGNGRVGDGIVFGDTKNFRMTNPLAVDQEIWYACVEGPENAAYVRGTAKLMNGRASVTFPEHFQIVAASEGMTAIVTPLAATSKGLAVISKSATGIEVAELRHGTGTYDFDWEVKSARKGHENYRVLRSKYPVTSAPMDSNVE